MARFRCLKPLLLSVGLVALAGCASSSGTRSAWNDCIDGTRQVYDFQVESPTSVVVKVAPSRQYRVTLDRPCEDLAEAESVGFSNGPARWIGRGWNGQPLWANSLNGTTQICGRAGDRLSLRQRGYQFDYPARTCNIARVQRL